MADYRKMYSVLCCSASEAIDRMEQGRYDEAGDELRAALLKAEEIYVRGDKKWLSGVWSCIRKCLPFLFALLAVGVVMAVGFFMGGVFVLRSGL